MAKLLHVIASPRGRESRSLRVSEALLKRFRAEFPGGMVDTLDLFKDDVPPFKGDAAAGRYAVSAGRHLDARTRRRWQDVEKQICRFLSADIILISTPMWNFSIPHALKNYIDTIVQPGYLYRRTEAGAQGLVKGKRMIVISSRGEDYGPGSPARRMDMLEPYLRAVFGFVGIWNITFISVQGMDGEGRDLEEKLIQEAIQRANAVPLAEKILVA